MCATRFGRQRVRVWRCPAPPRLPSSRARACRRQRGERSTPPRPDGAAASWLALRGGADLRAAATGADAPTPLSLAERLRAEGSAPAGSAADLVLRAAEPWSPQTHQLFPSEARARAVELWLLGVQFSRDDRSAIGDVWMAFVVPYAVTRE